MPTLSRLRSWLPARRHPQTYPGDCPPGAYVIVDDEVMDLTPTAGAPTAAVVTTAGGPVELDRLLDDRALPRLGERFPSLAYGANRNPGTLAIKMDTYRYASPGDGLVIPVLHGWVPASDVVGCGLGAQGYLYADLLLGDPEGPQTWVEAWLPMLDEDQVRVMHDGEQVPAEQYHVARYPFRLDGVPQAIQALGYAGGDPVYVSPSLGQPLAYAGVRATGRTFPTMTAVEMMDHAIEVGDLRTALGALVGNALVSSRTPDVMRFLNQQWWIELDGVAEPDTRYATIIDLIAATVEANRRPTSTMSQLRSAGDLLDMTEAYAPPDELRLSAQVAARF